MAAPLFEIHDPFSYLSCMKKICFLSGILLSAFLLTSCLRSYIEQNKKVGNTIVDKIEEYRAANDSLPDSLEGIGLDESIRITIEDKDGALFCYKKMDSLNYILWFGTTLGEGIYYYSDTKQWEDKLRAIPDQRKIRVDQYNKQGLRLLRFHYCPLCCI